MSLNDRIYMRGTQGPSESNDPSGRSMLWALIAVNVFLYIIAGPGTTLWERLALHCDPQAFGIHQLLTAGFIHGGFGHILFNMWGLYLFGSLVVPYMSGSRFLGLYLAGVLVGNVTFWSLNFFTATSLLGASGAVFAVMIAAAMLEPDRRFVMIFMPFSPLKTSTMVICYTILEVIFELTGSDWHVAHLAHLGGFAGGYILMKIYFGSRTAWDPLRFLRLPRLSSGSGSEYRRTVPPPPGHDDGGPVTGRELNALLDKISREGINSLSDHELARLRRAREEMRGERSR